MTKSKAADASSVDFGVAAMSDEEPFEFVDEFISRTPDELAADEGKVDGYGSAAGRTLICNAEDVELL